MPHLWGRAWTRAELMARIGRLEQVAGVELLEAADGPARGVRLLRFVSGGGLEFEVLVDRGFDIGRASFRGTPLAWWSPVGLQAPALVDSGGIEWFRGWAGGLVSTCGLDHTLLGGTDDTSHFNYPHHRTEEYGLHGRHTTIPARLVGYGTEWIVSPDGTDECVLWAEGEVRQVAIFGEQLELRRRVEVDLGGTSLRITDRVTNIGGTPSTHMLLYHCNIGAPIVAAGAELLYPAPPGTVVSDASTIGYRALGDPDPAFVEECYEHAMVPDADGTVSAGIANRALGLGVYQRYSAGTLPHHITWRQLGHGTYAVAMEPSTNRDAGRFDARERGELLFLAPGEERLTTLELGVLDGPGPIDDFARHTAALAGAGVGAIA